MPKNECINNIETNEGKMNTRPVKNSVARFVANFATFCVKLQAKC